MTRVYANNNELLIVARYFISKGITDVKAELLKSRYQVGINGQTRNVDYKLVEAMMFALQSVTAKPARAKRRTATSKSSLPEMGE